MSPGLMHRAVWAAFFYLQRRCSSHGAARKHAILDTVAVIRRLQGKPRRRPSKLPADKGYDYARCRVYLKKRVSASRIARRGVASSEWLGRHCSVVERTHGWFAGFSKLRIRFERRLDIHEALLKLAAATICALRGSVVLAALNFEDELGWLVGEAPPPA